jgi:predicted transposase YbfD/YdcC
MNIILEGYTNQVIAFNFAHLQHYLSQLPDRRSNRGKVYPLALILTYILIAKLAGCDKPSAIASWVRKRQAALLPLWESHHQRTPCLNTYRTILDEVVDEERLAKLFRSYLHETYGGQASQLVVMDGKTVRGTIPKGETQGVHLLAVYLPEEGIVLGQVEVGVKENEISAAAGVLAAVPLKHRVVCADAMQTQRQLSVEILAKGGEYLWTAKENQPTLRADIEQFFQPPRVAKGWHIPELPRWVAQTIDKGHGRIEVRHITVVQDVDGFLDWPGVQQLFKLVRQVTQIKSQQTTTEVVYGLTSCAPHRGSASQLLDWIRAYWGIENGLHYRRDKTLQEDATRFSLPKMPAVMATINNFVIGLTQRLGYANLPEARRIFDWSIACQLRR